MLVDIASIQQEENQISLNTSRLTPPLSKSAHHLFVNNQTHNFSPTEEASKLRCESTLEKEKYKSSCP